MHRALGQNCIIEMTVLNWYLFSLSIKRILKYGGADHCPFSNVLVYFCWALGKSGWDGNDSVYLCERTLPVCFSVLQRVAVVCCSVLQCVAVCVV